MLLFSLQGWAEGIGLTDTNTHIFVIVTSVCRYIKTWFLQWQYYYTVVLSLVFANVSFLFSELVKCFFLFILKCLLVVKIFLKTVVLKKQSSWKFLHTAEVPIKCHYMYLQSIVTFLDLGLVTNFVLVRVKLSVHVSKAESTSLL